MKFDQLLGTVQGLRNYYGTGPSFLIIHCAGNDIGQTRCGLLRYLVKTTISLLQVLLPGTVLIWSSILPRLEWRYSSNTKAMENSRNRINRAISSFITLQGGKSIKYPDFQYRTPGLFSDSVHLSFIGNDIFLNSLQAAMETFLNFPDVKIYPVE